MPPRPLACQGLRYRLRSPPVVHVYLHCPEAAKEAEIHQVSRIRFQREIPKPGGLWGKDKGKPVTRMSNVASSTTLVSVTGNPRGAGGTDGGRDGAGHLRGEGEPRGHARYLGGQLGSEKDLSLPIPNEAGGVRRMNTSESCSMTHAQRARHVPEKET